MSFEADLQDDIYRINSSKDHNNDHLELIHKNHYLK